MLPQIAWLTLTGIALLNASAAHAAPTVYAVNRAVGDVGTLIGTIATDGKIGTLQRENILDWDLTLNGDSSSATVGRLLGPLSGGNSLWNYFPDSALSTAIFGQTNTLLFDFGTASLQIFQITTPDSGVVWQMQAGIPFQDELLRESAGVNWQPVQTYAFHGPLSLVIGTASAVPEPSTILLTLIGGLGVLGCTTLNAKARSVHTNSRQQHLNR